jgi:2-polyprenyl-6-methoxyphenol hydroxylase-like FAD-dependent oxidoreductase
MRGPDSDVLIVGAGPAGSALGGLLAAEGIAVTIVDKQRHPRPKPCGELLNPGAVKLLAKMGLAGTLEELAPARILGWIMCTPGAPPAVARYPNSATGLSVARSRLDATLANWAVQQGVTLVENTRVQSATISPRPTAHTIEADGSRAERTARVIVGADGLNSLMASAIDPGRPAPGEPKLSLTAHMKGCLGEQADHRGLGVLHVTDQATVGLAPISSSHQEWNVTVVVDPRRFGRAVAADPELFHQGVLLKALRDADLEPETPLVLSEGPWASGPFDRPTRRVSARGMLLIGDASGYFDPLTGQGVYRALRSAELAFGVMAEALTRPGEVPSAALLRRYSRQLRASVRPGRALQRAVEWIVSRNAPRRRAFTRLAANPRAADRLLRVIGDDASILSFLHPEFLLALAGVSRGYDNESVGLPDSRPDSHPAPHPDTHLKEVR